MAEQPSRQGAAAAGVELEAPRLQQPAVQVRDLSIDMNGGPHQPGAVKSLNPMPPRRLKKKAKKERDDGQLAELSRWFLDNQAGSFSQQGTRAPDEAETDTQQASHSICWHCCSSHMPASPERAP